MEVSLIQIGSSVDHRGQINYLDVANQIPFEVKNVFFIKDVPSGASRGNHSNVNSHELLICIKGSFTVTIDHEKVFNLENSEKALLVPHKHWIELSKFSEGAVCLVLSSESYDPNEKITDA